MNVVKGFVTISQFINNSPGSISPIGEISTLSTTYSKEKGDYVLSTNPGYRLITFSNIDSDTLEKLTLTNDQVSQVLEVIKSCVIYSGNNVRPYNKLNYINAITAEYHNTIINVNVGNFIDDGVTALPEWIYWETATLDMKVKIWLADQSFLYQYDNYEIEIIPPIENLNDFFGNYAVISNTISLLKSSDLVERMNAIKANYPTSYYRLLMFDLFNSVNPGQFITTEWGVNIYGKAGNNIDSIKDTLITYILENSTYTNTQWVKLFPDIFKRTEFVLFPRWDKISIPNLTNMSNLYGSILNLKESLTFVKNAINYYTDPHVDDKLEFLPYDYKALTILSLPGEHNDPEVMNLSSLFPDYIPVNNLSTDFSRMNMNTQNWSKFIEVLIMTAETANENSIVPMNMRRVIVGGVMFMSQVFNNINYLVAVKSNSIYG